MAGRRNKVGLEFFYTDVFLSTADRILFAKYGAAGFGIKIRMHQEIFKEKGYYAEMGEDQQILFCDENNIDLDYLTNLINEWLKYKIFDENLYNEYSIITSEEVQEAYLKGCSKRVNVRMQSKYSLIEDLNEYNISISGEEILINSTEMTQSKEKKSKEEERKEKESIFNNIIFSPKLNIYSVDEENVVDSILRCYFEFASPTKSAEILVTEELAKNIKDFYSELGKMKIGLAQYMLDQVLAYNNTTDEWTPSKILNIETLRNSSVYMRKKVI